MPSTGPFKLQRPASTIHAVSGPRSTMIRGSAEPKERPHTRRRRCARVGFFGSFVALFLARATRDHVNLKPCAPCFDHRMGIYWGRFLWTVLETRPLSSALTLIQFVCNTLCVACAGPACAPWGQGRFFTQNGSEYYSLVYSGVFWCVLSSEYSIFRENTPYFRPSVNILVFQLYSRCILCIQ